MQGKTSPAPHADGAETSPSVAFRSARGCLASTELGSASISIGEPAFPLAKGWCTCRAPHPLRFVPCVSSCGTMLCGQASSFWQIRTSSSFPQIDSAPLAASALALAKDAFPAGFKGAAAPKLGRPAAASGRFWKAEARRWPGMTPRRPVPKAIDCSGRKPPALACCLRRGFCIEERSARSCAGRPLRSSSAP